MKNFFDMLDEQFPNGGFWFLVVLTCIFLYIGPQVLLGAMAHLIVILSLGWLALKLYQWVRGSNEETAQ